jgi:hypothetical protein
MSVGTFPYWPKDSTFAGSPDPFYRQIVITQFSNSNSNATGIGTLNGADTAPTSISDYMEFNTGSGYLQCIRLTDASDRFHITYPYSIEFDFYAYTPSTSDEKWLATSGGGAGLGFPEWAVVQQNNLVKFQSYSADNSSSESLNTTLIYDLQYNRWYRIGIMFVAANKIRFYINSEFLKESAPLAAVFNSANGFAIAGDNQNVTTTDANQLIARSRRWQGRIRNFRMGQSQWWRPNDGIPADPIYAPPVPQWVTGQGYITSFSENEVVNLPLIIEDPKDSIESYNITKGALPPGLSLNVFSGVITGTVLPVLQDERYTFTVSVVYGGNYTVSGDFELLILDESTEVTWVTPSGEVGNIAPGEQIYDPLEATSY